MWLETTAAARPDAPALVTPAACTSYAELLAQARRVAAELSAAGVAERDHVALALAPGERFVAALHACWLLDAVAVPIDPRLADGERAERTRGSVATVDEHAVRPSRSPAHCPADPDGTALIVHTSGTTSAPRPVALTRATIEANAHGLAAALGLDASDRWLCPLPLAHVGGLMILARCAIFGATVELLPPPFDAHAANAALHGGRVTLASLVPTMLSRTLDAGLADPPALRVAMLGGGPTDPELIERAHRAGVPVAATYGLTEACSTVTVADPAGPHAGAGRPIPGAELRIAPDGEILVAGPMLAPQAAPLLRTGDLGDLDAGGNLTVRGRKADTIVSGGENVAPQEVEAVLLAHPAIADAGVHPVPDRDWGEAIAARLVLRDGRPRPSDDELRAFCRARLAPFKLPKRFEWNAALPRNATGKLLRRELIASEEAVLR